MTALNNEIFNLEQMREFHRSKLNDDLDWLERQIANVRHQMEANNTAGVIHLLNKVTDALNTAAAFDSTQASITVLQRIDTKDSE